MSLSELNDSIACAAHREWCSRMIGAGWVPGDRLDTDQRTHPALRPYEELPLCWRHQLVQFIDSNHHATRLLDDVEVVLGTPEWTVDDVSVGMRVAIDDDPSDIGTIVSWDVSDDESGGLDAIRVRWPSGEVVNYSPAERMLIRVPD